MISFEFENFQLFQLEIFHRKNKLSFSLKNMHAWNEG